MKTLMLGSTGLKVTKTAFGALPIQRLSLQDAVALVRAARTAGINFFDTARVYSDSEEKLGEAFQGDWQGLVVATKTAAETGEQLARDLEESLRRLKTGHIDIYQFHNPSFVPRPGGTDGLYDAALAAQRAGKIGHIGITQHSLERAREAVLSGLYDTLQYPFNHLATEAEVELVRLCEARGMGFIAMKAMSGGLITDAAIPFAYLSQFGQAVPIWGMQRPEELAEFIALEANPPRLDAAMEERIARDRRELVGAFCRGCGYCLPCPVGIPINNANRMTQLITRSPSAPLLTEAWLKDMEKIEQCTHCGACEARCPYGLKPYETMPAHLAFYRQMYARRQEE